MALESLRTYSSICGDIRVRPTIVVKVLPFIDSISRWCWSRDHICDVVHDEYLIFDLFVWLGMFGIMNIPSCTEIITGLLDGLVFPSSACQIPTAPEGATLH
jgi:hypothetical protein